MTDPIAAHLAAVRRDRYSDATLAARARILATLPDPLGMDRLATLAWWESRRPSFCYGRAGGCSAFRQSCGKARSARLRRTIVRPPER